MVKEQLYFAAAAYFQFWAKMVLKRWNPFIIAVVGSAGKTTTLSFIEAVLKPHKTVKVSHKTNAVTAIPLDILGLHQKTFTVFEWMKLFVSAPFKSLSVPDQEMYLCEMDTDRNFEMAQHTKLIKPHITCWVSASPAHTQNFPGSTSKEIVDAMIDDQCKAALVTSKLLLVNGDDEGIEAAIARCSLKPVRITLSAGKTGEVVLLEHSIGLSGTTATIGFVENGKVDREKNLAVTFPLAIISKVNMYGVAMAASCALYLGVKPARIVESLKKFRLPPGRMSLFAGKKATTIIDSSYNASRPAVVDALHTLKTLGSKNTIAILGDMRELGSLSKTEHEAVAETIIKLHIRQVIGVGPLMEKHMLPKLVAAGYKNGETVISTTPSQALAIVTQNGFVKPGDTILVKGSQNTLFLERIVEELLASKKDVSNLCRREPIWEKQRNAVYSA